MRVSIKEICFVLVFIFGCGGTLDDNGDAEMIEQPVSRKELFAPAGSGLDFVGLYRLRNRATNECLKHDLGFGPCGQGMDETSDKVAVYRGVDGNFSVCDAVPPTLVAHKVCTNWEFESGSPDWSFDFIQFELHGGNIQDGAPIGDVVEVCTAEAQVFTFQSKCVGASSFAGPDAYGDSTNRPCKRDNNKQVCVSSQILSIKDEGASQFRAVNGNIATKATIAPGVFLLRSAETKHPEYPYYRRDTGGFLGNGKNKDELNYHWDPLYIPEPGGTAAGHKNPFTAPLPARIAATCTLSAKKTATNTELTWKSSKNALSCLMTIDGKVRASNSKCAGKLTLGNMAGGPSHEAKLFVAGPTGTKSCAVKFLDP